MWDPEKKGESVGWQAEKFDDSRWFNIRVDSAYLSIYEDHEVDKQWKAGHGGMNPVPKRIVSNPILRSEV